MGPLVLHDCKGSSATAGGSLQNKKEADAAAALLGRLFERWDPGSVAVLTPYRAQLQLLMRACAGVVDGRGGMEFATIDGFQGREADVVLLSCVRCVATCTTR